MKRFRSRTMDVEFGVTVTFDEGEREATLKFRCYPAQKGSRDCPRSDAYAEYLSGYFDDTGEDAEDIIVPDEYERQALEEARLRDDV